jgi:hypothetical protein
MIEVGLSHGRNAMAISQELVDTCGFTASYQKRPALRAQAAPRCSLEACAVIETAPSEETQVDYGTGPWSATPSPATSGKSFIFSERCKGEVSSLHERRRQSMPRLTGKYRRTRLFVMTLVAAGTCFQCPFGILVFRVCA